MKGAVLFIKQTLRGYSCMRIESAAAAVALAFAAASCGTRPVVQSEGHLQTAEVPSRTTTAMIPPPVPAVPMPPPPEAREQELRYSVVVANQSVRDVLFAMARETKVNFDIHPDIEGTVTINAIDQTLKQILDRMAKQVDMRWEQQGQTIIVMRDTPYLHTYRVDYVNMSHDDGRATHHGGDAGRVAGGAGGRVPGAEAHLPRGRLRHREPRDRHRVGARDLAPAREGAGIPRPGDRLRAPPGADRGDRRGGRAQRQLPDRRRLVGARPQRAGLHLPPELRRAEP